MIPEAARFVLVRLPTFYRKNLQQINLSSKALSLAERIVSKTLLF